jgi:hypothetical protein
MPIPRNWSEELVHEWLNLRGYLTDVGVPLGSPSVGGRFEADIVGVLANENNNHRILEIYHVEVGSLSDNLDKNINRILKKFSDGAFNMLKERYVKRIGNADEFCYINLYIDTWGTKQKINRLENDERIKKREIKICIMDDLYRAIYEAIDDWKKAPGFPVRSGAKPTLPEGYWMLKLIDHLDTMKLLRHVPEDISP